jgi:hypothetical protein
MSLRISAADRLLALALPDEDRDPRSAFQVDPHQAVEVAQAAVSESLAAARDGRDTASMRSLVGLQLAKVATTMVGVDLLNLKDISRQSLEQCFKQWDERFAALEKDARDDDSKRVLANIRKETSRPTITDGLVDAMLLPRQCKPVMEAFFRALDNRDKEAMKAVHTPTTAAKLAEVDIDAWVKEMFGETPVQIRLLSTRARYQRSQDDISIPCNVLWVDQDGVEHLSLQIMPVVKTEKGWLIGEK